MVASVDEAGVDKQKQDGGQKIEKEAHRYRRGGRCHIRNGAGLLERFREIKIALAEWLNLTIVPHKERSQPRFVVFRGRHGSLAVAVSVGDRVTGNKRFAYPDERNNEPDPKQRAARCER